MNSKGECQLGNLDFMRIFQSVMMVLYTFLVAYLAVSGVND
jgi:hypothetical protein